MSRDPGDVSAEDPGGGLDEEKLVAEAQERIDDVVVEFGPDAPSRGATPGNSEVAEEPN
jgi:hypothetical protein